MSGFVVIWLCLALGPVLIWLLFRSKGYKRKLLDSPPPGWVFTGESFEDPTTREMTTVWQSAAGERCYVRDTKRRRP